MSSKAPSKPSPKEAKPSPNAPEKPAKEPAPAPTNPSPKPAPAGPSPPPESAPKQPKAKNIEPVASPKASGDKSPVPAPANASKLEKEVSSPRVAPENSDRSSVQRDKSKEMQAERDKRLGKVKAGESGLKQRDGSPSGGSGSPNRIASDQRKRGEKVDGNTIMNKTGLGKLNDSMPKIKRTFHEELNLKLKDTFVSPAVGLKYSHEKLMDRYVRETLASREDRNKEILDKIKDRARPIDHDLLNRHELEYLALSLKERQAREEKTKQRAKEIREAEFHGAKSKAYLRVSQTVHKLDPNIQRIEQGQKVLEMRNQYSEIVRDVFFKDALVAQKSKAQVDLPKEAISTRDIKLEADKKRKAEYESIKRRYELGEKYLEEIRSQNALVPESKRRELELKRFEANRRIPKPVKDRKFIDQVRRYYVEPKEIVAHKDLLKNLNPTKSSDSKVAVLKVVESLDSQIKQKEMRVKYRADQKHSDNNLGDMYISSIQTKLDLLETQTKKKKPSKQPKNSKDLKALMEHESDNEGDY